MRTWLCVAVLVLGSSRAHAAGFVIVERGQARCSVVSKAGGAVGAFAVSELKRYVKQMSGVELGADAGRARIILSLDHTLGWDASAIDVDAERVELGGGNERGLLYAVYQVLEDLGCRFLTLGPEGENVPRRNTLVLPVGKCTMQPALRYRGLIVQQPLSERNLLMADWMAKNKMKYWVNPCWAFPGPDKDLKSRFVDALEKRGILWEFGHHTFAHWITRRGRDKELLGWKGGKRTSEAICISNPRAAQKVADNIAAFVKVWPQVDVVSVWANDGVHGWCECEQCEKLYGDLPMWRGRVKLMAKPYFWFVGQVAGALRTRGIKQPICTLAYVNTIELAEGVEFAANTLVTVAPIGRNYAKPIAKLEYFGPIVDQWAARLGSKSELGADAARVMAYEYYAGVYANNSLPIPTVTELADDIAHYARTGFGGITTQAEEGHWGTYGLNFYALARMGYHGPRAAPAFIANFCKDYYRAAAPAMTEYWQWQETLMRSQENVGPAGHFFHLLRRTAGAIDRLDQCVARAEALADHDVVRTRVRLSRLSVEYVKLLRDAIEAGRGQALDAIEPTPKGKGHLPAIVPGASVHLRFPVPKEGGLALCLGNVVAMSGAGSSYQMEVRRDAEQGAVIHKGKVFEGSTEEAEKHIPGRAWNKDNAIPVAVTAFLSDADRARGHIDIYVTCHTTGDRWTLYRDDNTSRTRDIRAETLPANAAREREEAWRRLDAFVKENSRAGILNAAPGFVLSRCKRMVGAGR